MKGEKSKWVWSEKKIKDGRRGPGCKENGLGYDDSINISPPCVEWNLFPGQGRLDQVWLNFEAINSHNSV